MATGQAIVTRSQRRWVPCAATPLVMHPLCRRAQQHLVLKFAARGSERAHQTHQLMKRLSQQRLV